MAFQRMMTDRIKVIKTNGDEYSDLKASVQDKGIYLMQSNVLIETNDLIQRFMSSGGEETYKVIDPGFHEKFHSIPAHYQIKAKKLGIPEAKEAVQNITYNFHGDNARVNNNSVDNSTNIVNQNSEIVEHILLLRSEIDRLVQDTAEKKEALEVVDAIELQIQSDKPSKAVVKTLLSALPHAGSIASVGSFLLSIL
ncbi:MULTISPECIES: hypothetical protein [Vibrio]|uniref:hypothetical protein n=1 Tax=Vibrio TaxID=662 RepID=UPI0009A26F2F|nr:MULTISPECIES: hypothetical protein [Vibrio]MCR9589555.1 hypothetical protein [Vibrio alginolyticus]MCS0411152.1 hypothetical protein [Vibrio diabolicus]MDF4865193.1 hypothetical protein [Vibrio parahaemolyticus]MEA5286732.1 hypothetical protein [Vibrio parahaemolyticus]MRE00906.1 hypothetical protein [Vibrio parahaemolyticus]